MVVYYISAGQTSLLQAKWEFTLEGFSLVYAWSTLSSCSSSSSSKALLTIIKLTAGLLVLFWVSYHWCSHRLRHREELLHDSLTAFFLSALIMAVALPSHYEAFIKAGHNFLVLADKFITAWICAVWYKRFEYHYIKFTPMPNPGINSMTEGLTNPLGSENWFRAISLISDSAKPH